MLGCNTQRARRRLTVAASCTCLLILSGAQPFQPLTSWAARARAAKSVVLNESGHLHLISKHNFTLNEQGTASGTASGAIYVHLTAVSSTRVTVEVNIYPRGGSISGRGNGNYHRVGASNVFSGTFSIGRGTGSYGHIHGSGLSFSGTIEEAHRDAITVHVIGRISD